MRMPSRSIIGSSSSIERYHSSSQISGSLGLPASSVLITCTPISTAISIIRRQFLTAAWRRSSPGPDQRYTTINEEISTPVAFSAFLYSAITSRPAFGCL
ncbi:hypothetical protein D3C80_1290480 [compost metagenome]